MRYQKTTYETYSVAHISVPKSPVFVAWTSMDVHGTNSAKRQAVAMAYEEALLSGCQGMTREQFLDAINKLGATVSIQVEDGSVGIMIKGTADVSGKLIDLYARMLTRPTFAERELARIKQLLGNILAEHEEAARDRARECLANSFFATTDRRYTADPKTLAREVKKLTTKDLRSFHQEVLRAYFIHSLYATPATIDKFTQTITTIKQGRPLRLPRSTHAPQEPREQLQLLSIPSKQNIEFSIGGQLPLSLHHPDYLPFFFGLSVLGNWGGFAGRLMSIVREQEGLTYSIYARPESVRGDEGGYWRIMTFFAPGQAGSGLTSTTREIKKIHEKGVTKDEHARFQDILRTRQLLINDSAARAIDSLHAFQTAGFSIEEMFAFKGRLLSVTRKEVNQALRTYLDPAKVVIVGAGPVKGVEKSLKTAFSGGIL